MGVLTSRVALQISGGHRYQPPRQDVYAPDLYIPFMAVCTYIVLFSIVQTAEGKFTHDSMYITVSLWGQRIRNTVSPAILFQNV